MGPEKNISASCFNRGLQAMFTTLIGPLFLRKATPNENVRQFDYLRCRGPGPG